MAQENSALKWIPSIVPVIALLVSGITAFTTLKSNLAVLEITQQQNTITIEKLRIEDQRSRESSAKIAQKVAVIEVTLEQYSKNHENLLRSMQNVERHLLNMQKNDDTN